MSRRGAFVLHYAGDRHRRCPVCQHALEADHAEALVLAAADPDRTLPAPVGFALVEAA